MKGFYKTSKFYSIATKFTKFQYLRLVEKQTKPQLGKWIKDNLVIMGPTFIKIGQFLSTRTDVFGEEITNQLKELQDNVAPLSFKEIESYIEPIKSYLSNFEQVPIAAASIGQVHLAKKMDGTEVVIKIKRPNIENEITDDFETLLFCVSILKQVSNDRKIREFEILFKEYYKILLEEIDFKREAKNMLVFKDKFKNKKYVKIPYVCEDLCNNNIITMEYVPSIKIDNVNQIQKMGFNRETIAQKLIELYIKQIIEYGKVHIDPHPGNVGITKNGKIVYYDFGMVLDLDSRIKEKFMAFLIAVYDKDVNSIASIAIDMDLIVVEPKDIPYFKTFLIAFLNYIESANIEEFKISYIDKINVTTAPFLISSKFVLLLRGISILEGVCKQLDRNFNFKKTLDPYIDELILDVNYFEARAKSDLKLITKVPDKVQISQIQLEVLERTVRDVEKNIKKEYDEKYMLLAFLVIIVELMSIL
jgi:predicted unusual protein kinase regulating ubiquinone biosynthesis (AarF/ABC1/UbiB family)